MTDELRSLIVEVMTSWQVIFITVAIVVYLSLVFYVVRYTKKVPIPKKPKQPKPPKPKKEKKPAAEEEDDDEK